MIRCASRLICGTPGTTASAWWWVWPPAASRRSPPGAQRLLEEVAKRELKNVTVSQTGCIGVCRLEPIVEVYVPGQEKVTYVKMTPDKVASIVSEHLVNGRVVTEYTIGAAE